MVIFRRLSVPSAFGTRLSGGEDFRFRSPFSRSFRRSSASNVVGGFLGSSTFARRSPGNGGASLGASIGISLGVFGVVIGGARGAGRWGGRIGAEVDNFLARF